MFQKINYVCKVNLKTKRTGGLQKFVEYILKKFIRVFTHQDIFVRGKCSERYNFLLFNIYLFSFLKVTHGCLGLSIVKVEIIIIVKITLKIIAISIILK